MKPPSILHKGTDSSEGTERLGPYQIQTLIPLEEEGNFTGYHVFIEPNTTTPTSFHKKAEEIYYVIAGKGRIVLNGTTKTLQKADFLRLPAETRHSFETDEVGLSLLNIHSPGSRPDRDVFFEGNTPSGFHQ